MAALSPWALKAKEALAGPAPVPLFSKKCNGYIFIVQHTAGSLWMTAANGKGVQVAFRLAFSLNDLGNIKKEEEEQKIKFSFDTSVGNCVVQLEFPENDAAFFHYTTTLTASAPLFIPFWPRDIIVTGTSSAGNIHVRQQGARSGILYMNCTKSKPGSLMYMQNLSALSEYCEITETSLKDTVGGEWPELGFALPPTNKKPFPAGKPCIISDAFVILDHGTVRNEFEIANLFLTLLARIYIHLPRPETTYCNWLSIADKTLHDLENSSACWLHVNGRQYLNAYVADYATPPEIMVQLAVLLPLMQYSEWSKKETSMTAELQSGLCGFFDEKIGSVVRWLPGMEDQLTGVEEHKKPRIMDSWYLHHPLLNLSRLAIERNDNEAAHLFVLSVEFAIKVAHHFKYNWPVFYNIDTLEVVKEETQPGKGGEKDVAGIYAHVMLQAWQLTKEKRFLNEAKKAAAALKGKGFELFYQANNTAFAAGAMLRLWKETRNKLYLNLSYLCLANIFKNVWLWNGSYGNASHYPTFFAVFPLSDGPYTAVYEEQEVFSAFHDYLEHSEGEDILPAVSVLLPEFIRFMMWRAKSYYPCYLPKKILAEKPRTGEMDQQLWIPVEDLHEGREQSGEVGQEVYGAGFPFALVSSHYIHVRGQSFKLYIDYPISAFQKRRSAISFFVKGDDRLSCRMLLLAGDDKQLPVFQVKSGLRSDKQEIMAKIVPNRYVEYQVPGNQKITVNWKFSAHPQKKKRKPRHKWKQHY
jgi:hypothetical protein